MHSTYGFENLWLVVVVVSSAVVVAAAAAFAVVVLLLLLLFLTSNKNMKSTGFHDGMGVEGWFGVVGVV